MAKKTTKKKAVRFNLIAELHEAIPGIATVTRTGEIRIKRTELKNLLEDTIGRGLKMAAGGERVRFPVIGTLARREVKARKSGKGVNPFTGEPMDIKARPASKKPRWSFPRNVKDVFADKKNW